MSKKGVCGWLLACLLIAVGTTSCFGDFGVSSKSSLSSGNEAISMDMEWNNFETYQIEQSFSEYPKTVEAWIQLDPNYKGKGGVIAGCYNGTAADSVNFEIATNGHPQLFIVQDSKKVTCEFSEVDVRSEESTHLAFVIDGNIVSIYVNGSLKGSKECEITASPKNCYVIGGDNRSGNGQYFKGKIKSIAIYEDVRSAEEIVNDKNEVDKTDAHLLGTYSFEGKNGALLIEDASPNDNDLKRISDWLSVSQEPKEPEDYAYSFMVIGDTQIVTNQYPDYLPDIYDYVLNNVESKKVKHVFGLGDITDRDTKAEWELAKTQISRLDGVVSYSLIRGNHDGPVYYDEYFGGTSKYAEQYFTAYQEGSSLNTAHKFSAGNLDYLVINLDFGACDGALNWASGIIEAHPNHNVIITTHGYLNAKGMPLTENDAARPTYYAGTKYIVGPDINNGDHMWNELLKKHKNIVLVMSGHISSEDVVVSKATGDNGNIVTQVLIDPQGIDAALFGTGMVATFYVSEDGKTITVDYYSTIKEKYYKECNQFSFEINTIPRATVNG